MTNETLAALLPYILVFIGAGAAFWNARNKRRDAERENWLSYLARERELVEIEREAWKDEALRRDKESAHHWHYEGERRYYLVQEDFGLSRVYDKEYKKPKRHDEPRYALGDDGELIPVTDTGDEKPKRGE